VNRTHLHRSVRHDWALARRDARAARAGDASDEIRARTRDWYRLRVCFARERRDGAAMGA